MRESSVADNPEFLTSSYVPDGFLFREREKPHLLSCLLNSVNLFIYGRVGSGKTTLLRSTIEEFNSASQAKAIYIEGILHQTTNSILREVVSALSSLSAMPKGHFEPDRKGAETQTNGGNANDSKPALLVWPQPPFSAFSLASTTYAQNLGMTQTF